MSCELDPPPFDIEASLEKFPAIAQPTECIESDARSASEDLTQGKNQPWGIFVSTFLTVLFAELGDKTQLTTLLMSAESQAPWIVFTGAASALLLTSLLGVLLGQWLAKRISPRVLETSAGISLLLMSIWLMWDVMMGQ
jgi:putative Ca2+/H+ antiporter (TMEM165/GDT1 family)